MSSCGLVVLWSCLSSWQRCACLGVKALRRVWRLEGSSLPLRGALAAGAAPLGSIPSSASKKKTCDSHWKISTLFSSLVFFPLFFLRDMCFFAHHEFFCVARVALGVFLFFRVAHGLGVFLLVTTNKCAQCCLYKSGKLAVALIVATMALYAIVPVPRPVPSLVLYERWWGGESERGQRDRDRARERMRESYERWRQRREAEKQ